MHLILRYTLRTTILEQPSSAGLVGPWMKVPLNSRTLVVDTYVCPQCCKVSKLANVRESMCRKQYNYLASVLYSNRSVPFLFSMLLALVHVVGCDSSHPAHWSDTGSSCIAYYAGKSHFLLVHSLMHPNPCWRKRSVLLIGLSVMNARSCSVCSRFCTMILRSRAFLPETCSASPTQGFLLLGPVIFAGRMPRTLFYLVSGHGLMDSSNQQCIRRCSSGPGSNYESVPNLNHHKSVGMSLQ